MHTRTKKEQEQIHQGSKKRTKPKQKCIENREKAGKRPGANRKKEKKTLSFSDLV